jgi:hypothetical protein
VVGGRVWNKLPLISINISCMLDIKFNYCQVRELNSINSCFYSIIGYDDMLYTEFFPLIYA